jgi:hypothetical protein
LAQSAPSSQQLFVRLAENGENLGRATQQFLRLLDDYGAMQVEQAIRESLRVNLTSHHAVRHLLEQGRRAAGRAPAVHVDLPDDSRVRDVTVTPHNLAGYDVLLDVGQAEQEVRDDANSS